MQPYTNRWVKKGLGDLLSLQHTKYLTIPMLGVKVRAASKVNLSKIIVNWPGPHPNIGTAQTENVMELPQ